MESKISTQYTYEQLISMGKIYYSGKANDFQIGKYELIRAELFTELQLLNPKAKDKGTAAYIWGAIERCNHNKQEEEQCLNDQARANAHTTHNQLLNYDLAAKQKERK